MEWLINNLELFSAVYTFLGQYRFYQAISVEALPGRDPLLVDVQYNLRVEANYNYSIAALTRILIQYLKNLDFLIPDTANNTGTITTTNTNVEADLDAWLASNKTSRVPVRVMQEKTVTAKLIRKPGSKRWQQISTNEVTRVYPIEQNDIRTEGVR